MKKVCLFLPLFPLAAFHLSAQVSQDGIHRAALSVSEKYGLTSADMEGYVISDNYTRPGTGSSHVYLTQTAGGHVIFNAILQLHFTADGKLAYSNSRFLPNKLAKTNAAIPAITPQTALKNAAREIGIHPDSVSVQTEQTDRTDQTVLKNENLFVSPVNATLGYEPMGDKLVLAYKLIVMPRGTPDAFNIRVDALTGKVIQINNRTVHCQPLKSVAAGEAIGIKEFTAAAVVPLRIAANATYYAFPLGVESPIYGDQQLITGAEHLPASPFGWHDDNGIPGPEYTTTRGNNVYAYEDQPGNNTPGYFPDAGSGLNFIYPMNLQVDPVLNMPSSITNLFVWNNFMHDVTYFYGFDEVSGNFQTNNYNNGGSGNDLIFAEGFGSVCCYMLTPEDGSSPHLEMGVMANDADFDNCVISHEYTHGVSNRLTGGPSNVDCLLNAEQPGEGWSDFFGLVMTDPATGHSAIPRPVGNFLAGQPVTGPGARDYPYAVDMAINPLTYGYIHPFSDAHEIGTIWCTMLWDLYWNMVAEYGHSHDLYAQNGGNNKAIRLVVEGMRLQPCSPGFVDARDAILQADQMLYDGENQCIIWRSFGRRGLGLGATQGSSLEVDDEQEDFTVPPACASPAGIEENSQPQVSVYPNPTTDVLYINIDNGQNITSVRVTDISGKQISQQTINTANYSLNTENLAAGMYLLHVQMGEHNQTVRFIKR